jgi:hypothetical protein
MLNYALLFSADIAHGRLSAAAVNLGFEADLLIFAQAPNARALKRCVCTNTSLPPPSGAMNPKPFCSLKNFTVPVGIEDVLQKLICALCGTLRFSIFVRSGKGN